MTGISKSPVQCFYDFSVVNNSSIVKILRFFSSRSDLLDYFLKATYTWPTLRTQFWTAMRDRTVIPGGVFRLVEMDRLSEVLTTTIMTMSNDLDYGGSRHHWDVSQYLPDYTAQHPRRQLSSHSPSWVPEISLWNYNAVIIACLSLFVIPFLMTSDTWKVCFALHVNICIHLLRQKLIPVKHKYHYQYE
jgi:hypothetical protein